MRAYLRPFVQAFAANVISAGVRAVPVIEWSQVSAGREVASIRPDQYSLGLVLARALYDDGVAVQESPAPSISYAPSIDSATSSPISVVKIWSAAMASSICTRSRRRWVTSMVVSHSCSGFISPRPL